jgi:hypothetical protein
MNYDKKQDFQTVFKTKSRINLSCGVMGSFMDGLSQIVEMKAHMSTEYPMGPHTFHVLEE